MAEQKLSSQGTEVNKNSTSYTSVVFPQKKRRKRKKRKIKKRPGARLDKADKMAFSPREDSDQPWHPSSLIRVFAMRSMRI